MELIPIIENSLLIFIGVLLIVVLFSYLSFKLGNSASGKSSPHSFSQSANKNRAVIKQQSDNYISVDPEQYSMQPENYLLHGNPHSYANHKPSPVEKDNNVISKRFVVVNDLAQETSFSSYKRRLYRTNS